MSFSGEKTCNASSSVRLRAPVLSGGTLQGSLRPSTTMLKESTEAYHYTLTLYLTKSTYYTSRVGLCNMTKHLYPNKGHHKTAHFLSFYTQTMSMRQKQPLFRASVQCLSSVMSCSLNSIFICVAFMQTSSCRRTQSIKMMEKYCCDLKHNKINNEMILLSSHNIYIVILHRKALKNLKKTRII